jgi:hypothetical protein
MPAQRFALALALAVPACLGSAPIASRAGERGDALPAALASYASGSAAARVELAAHEHRYYFEPETSEPAAPQSQSYWPVLYSLLMPGVGGLTMGYTFRGVLLMAVEVAAWTGYFYYHDDGLEKRDEYEAFADQWWDMQKWLDDHPCPTLPPVPPSRTLDEVEACGQATSGSGVWPGYVPYVSKDEDKQHYYENIGKYDWYISGWADWDPSSNPYAEDTDLRDEYRAMRNESNEALDDANSFVWVSLATRVFSVAETAIIVRNRRQAGAQASGRREVPVAVRARPRGFDGAELALEVRFK